MYQDFTSTGLFVLCRCLGHERIACRNLPDRAPPHLKGETRGAYSRHGVRRGALRKPRFRNNTRAAITRRQFARRFTNIRQ